MGALLENLPGPLRRGPVDGGGLRVLGSREELADCLVPVLSGRTASCCLVVRIVPSSRRLFIVDHRCLSVCLCRHDQLSFGLQPCSDPTTSPLSRTCCCALQLSAGVSPFEGHKLS